ncbi:MAG: hypothetical protein AVDCRST_MAG79-886, partial [uncultured Thermoleophilia bacterium]
MSPSAGREPRTAAAALLTAATDRLAPLEHRYQLAAWDLHTRESPEHQAAFEEAGIAYETALADPELHGAAEEAEAAADDPVTRRSAEVLRLATAGKRRPPDLIERTVRLESELTRIYGEHRAVVDGRRLSANDVDEVLGSSTDVAERRAVWEASKTVGAQVDAPLRELVRLRNEAARALGHRDHYAMSLALDEIDETWLFELLDRLDAGLADAWSAEKAAIDATRRERLGLPSDEPVQAWHLVDPFGQEPPSPADDPLRDVEATIDIEGVAR